MTRIGDEHRRALGLGLSGAHRTGKTTVAGVLAKEGNCPLILSSATSVAKEIAFKLDGSEPPARRRLYQDEVLRRFEKVWATESQNGLFVCDRTPLDMAAYVLSDWHLSTSDEAHDAWVLDYVDRCIEITGRYFFAVALIQPGIKFEARPDKPPPSKLYQELLNTTIMGLGSDMRVRSHFLVVPRKCVGITERAGMIGEWFDERMEDYSERLHERLPLSA
jgi:predicted ATPase